MLLLWLAGPRFKETRRNNFVLLVTVSPAGEVGIACTAGDEATLVYAGRREGCRWTTPMWRFLDC